VTGKPNEVIPGNILEEVNPNGRLRNISEMIAAPRAAFQLNYRRPACKEGTGYYNEPKGYSYAGK
jgi:hypothetical protein